MAGGGLGAVMVDPDLFDHALGLVAEAVGRRRAGNLDTLATSAQAYVEWIGLDAAPGEDALAESDVRTIGALAARLTALADLIEAGHYQADIADEASHAALVEAACSATLLEAGGRPKFQLLDFVAAVARAEGKPQW